MGPRPQQEEEGPAPEVGGGSDYETADEAPLPPSRSSPSPDDGEQQAPLSPPSPSRPLPQEVPQPSFVTAFLSTRAPFVLLVVSALFSVGIGSVVGLVRACVRVCGCTLLRRAVEAAGRAVLATWLAIVTVQS